MRQYLVLALLFSTPALAFDDDDPGIERRMDGGSVTTASMESFLDDDSLTELPTPLFHLMLAGGMASPLEDPDVKEGYGGALSLAVGYRFGMELRTSFAKQLYVSELDQFIDSFYVADASLGPYFQVFPDTDAFNIYLSAAPGVYGMVGLSGITASMGVRMGAGLEWRVTNWFGLRFDPQYHIFHLKEVAGPTYYDKRSFQKVGAMDRMDLWGALVFHI